MSHQYQAHSSNYIFPAPMNLMLPPTQQFGVSLRFIKRFNKQNVDGIPPVVRQCVNYLSSPEALETKGIFWHSANGSIIEDLKRKSNRGEDISFNQDPHIAAVLLKSFFHDLEEPILTYDLFKEIQQWFCWSPVDRERNAKLMVAGKLPMENYTLLKYIVKFLLKVKNRNCVNKMTTENLATAFGPCLAWPFKEITPFPALTTPVISFTGYLIDQYEIIFSI